MKVLKYKYNPNKKGVFRVSTVHVPAVGLGDLVLMSAQEIKGIFYAPVMIPDIKIPRIDEATGEKYLVYYDSETVEQLSNNYFKQCGNRFTNIEHAEENTEGIYPVESWIVKDPENDKSKALGMPLQKEGTWIMGYKCESPEVLDKVKNNLLQGLSIEGLLDMEEDTDSPIAKFNKHKVMSKPLLEALTDLKAVIMSAISGEEKPEEKEKTAEELAAEEEKKKSEMAASDEEAAKKAAEEAAKTPPPVNEVETLKAEIEEKDKKIAELEAELATYKNDATLMSAQLTDVQKAFESYKTVKMSSTKLTDLPNPKIEKPYAEMSNAEKTKHNRNK